MHIRKWSLGVLELARISLIRPLDQPVGERRLLQDLKLALCDERLTEFRLIVAYAKSGPLYRLQELIEEWASAGKTIEAIFGIDQRGTSKEALEFALSWFDAVYVTQGPGIIFHPKFYLFVGEDYAQVTVGSNNLTVGGTEKNFESAIQLELDLPDDGELLDAFESAWAALLPNTCGATCPLNEQLLDNLVEAGLVVDEKVMRTGAANDARVGRGTVTIGSGLVVKPESPLPKGALSDRKKITNLGIGDDASVSAAPTRGFAIQVRPHHNGEIFLSVTAALQNPGFFNWPFNGLTTPKKANNPSYPQLDPDPIVDITVIGKNGKQILALSSYPLNTVYYEKKSEIRITASPLVSVVPEYSIMIMERSDDQEKDYEIVIHTPSSPDFEQWLASCNQRMPGGGKTPRRYGWF